MLPLLWGLPGYEQEKKVYDSPDVAPEYQRSMSEKFRYLNTVATMIGKLECRDGSYDPLTSLKVDLTIGKDGKVLDADFLRSDLSKACNDSVRTIFLKMPGWKAGQVKGQNVVSKTRVIIGCIRWEEE